MLLGGAQPKIKQVAVVTRNLRFNTLLSSILADWKFFAVEDPSLAEVIFAERGIHLPSCAGRVVWLSPMPLGGELSLEIPISLTKLYHLLEAQLFPTPRRHIRVYMETAVDLKLEDEWVDGCLVSLSGRGGRITCEREMPRGQLLDLSARLGKKNLMISAEVLYCIPAGDSPGRLQPQIGVFFKQDNGNEFDMLRRFIERTCVERACAKEDIALTDPCLSWLDLPADPWVAAGS